MTIEDVDKIYRVLEGTINGKFLFARGGYYSLLKQKILKQTRDIGDLDMNVLRPMDSPMTNNDWDNVNRLFANFVSGFKQERTSKDFDLTMTSSSKGGNFYGREEDEDDDGADEANSFLTISLGLRNKARSAVTKSPMDFAEWLTSSLNPGVSGYATYTGNTTSVITTAGQYITSGSIGTARSPGIQPPDDDKETINSFSLSMMEKSALRKDLIDLMITRCSSIKLDIFCVNINDNSNKVKFIGDDLYVSPYVILSVKHRYCSNMSMAYPLFLKHIRDLEDSHRAIRIKGVNLPEDTFLLRENRRIYDEQKTQ